MALYRLIFILGLWLNSAQGLRFFRRDYKHNAQTDSFYKLYNNFNGNWTMAMETCDDDGAVLFYPNNKDEIMTVRDVLSYNGKILLGIRDIFGTGEFTTVDGSVTPMPIFASEVPHQNGLNCMILNMDDAMFTEEHCNLNTEDTSELEKFTNLSFICKKTVEPEACPTVDKAYIFDENVNKCLKINYRPKTWQDAFMTCFMEGGFLVVFESDEEVKGIRRRLINKQTHYFIGFRKISQTGVFYTSRGTKMDDGLYQKWNNKMEDSTQECGALQVYDQYGNNEVKYVTELCEQKLPFICEMAGNNIKY